MDAPGQRTSFSGTLKGAIMAIVVAVVGGGAVFFLTREGGPLNTAPMSGDIVEAPLSIGTPCCSFSVQVRLEGFKGNTCVVRHFIVNADTGVTLPGQTELQFTPEANEDQARADAAVPLEPGRWYVRFVLYEPGGGELDRLDTEPVGVSLTA